MSTNLKSLRSLVAMARRRGEQLEAAVADARRELAARQAATEDARRHRVVMEEARRRIERERDALLSGSFVPAALIATDLRESEAAAAVRDADAQVRQRREDETDQGRAVRAAQAAVQRNDQRIEGLTERIDALVRERELALQERDEEEAEEAATGRFIARGAAARKEAT